MAHRVTISNEARYTQKSEADILVSILEETPVPPGKARMFDEAAGK